LLKEYDVIAKAAVKAYIHFWLD